MQQWFNQLVSFLPIVPKGVWVAVGALPIILAVFSMRVVIILGSALAIAVCFFVMLEPHSIFLIVATAAYLGGILVAVYGIQIRLRDLGVHNELATLKLKLTHLEQAEARRLMGEMRKIEFTNEKKDNSITSQTTVAASPSKSKRV